MSNVVRRHAGPALAALALVGLAAVWLVAVAAAPAPAGGPMRHVVEIRGFEFVPARLEVSAGDTVVWINQDIVPHTATAADSTWDSGRLDEGESYALVVQEGGAQEYVCAFHPGMSATLIVRPSRGSLRTGTAGAAS